MAEGDEAALQELLDRYWGPLVAYANGILEGPPAAAEDVAQDAILDLWERRADWSPEGTVRSYLYQAARHLALNRIRHERVRSRSSDEVERAERARRPNPTPLERLERAELREALEGAIDELPPRRREVFSLGYLHGFTHREIAETMEISVQTSKNQMSAALAELRSILRAFLR